MKGEKYKSEMKKVIDQKTGHTIIQLTGGDSNNYHFYFTENSFINGRKEIIFFSDRGAKEAFHFNLFSMNLDTGEMIQLTDSPVPIGHNATKTPDGRYIFFCREDSLIRLDTKTLEELIIYENDPACKMGMMSLNSRLTRIGFARNEATEVVRGKNYAGFMETMFAVKRSFLTVVDIDGHNPFDAFTDTHQMAHFQFAPDDDTIGTFCHEGPWNLVQQRIWIFDFMSRTVIPCFRQERDDCVGHEFWTRDGLIFFDNRRAGHDGTITSEKKQTYAVEPEQKQIPYIGFADRRGTILRTVEMPFYCNHYHANNDNSILVGDDVEDLQLINISDETARMRTLCFHGTSWYGQTTHCHPTFDWDGRYVLYTSDFGGKHNIYMIDTGQVKWQD
ncbi:MAG: oligogalacturonate lyase family protein [Treponema sp.]|jgi:oligogalacturonide lyase|nr:oligogalacturonate lyase family protein [Treponema sp.]